MTERGEQLHAAVDEQLAELIGLLSTVDDATLRRRCDGREKLGDGTIAASASHTADNYRRIADFVQTSARMSRPRQGSEHGAHRIPRLVQAIGHRPPDDGQHAPSGGHHDQQYKAVNIEANAILQRVSTSRERLRRIGDLKDGQLDAIPPKGSFRFCDGQRTLEQVLTSLLRHQRHQLDALQAAIG
jgi:hypothetical protein